jgi:hypothetical protein
MGKIATILLAYFDLIFFTTYLSLVLYVFGTLFAMSINVILAFDISTQIAYISFVWQIFKNYINRCLFIILCSSPNMTLILLCSESNF